MRALKNPCSLSDSFQMRDSEGTYLKFERNIHEVYTIPTYISFKPLMTITKCQSGNQVSSFSRTGFLSQGVLERFSQVFL